jgi:spermidine synthase
MQREFTMIEADWSPSTSIADAWEAMGEYWKTRRTRYCTIRERSYGSWVFTLSVNDLGHLKTSADTPARAIALALYRATGDNDE